MIGRSATESACLCANVCPGVSTGTKIVAPRYPAGMGQKYLVILFIESRWLQDYHRISSLFYATLSKKTWRYMQVEQTLKCVRLSSRERKLKRFQVAVKNFWGKFERKTSIGAPQHSEEKRDEDVHLKAGYFLSFPAVAFVTTLISSPSFICAVGEVPFKSWERCKMRLLFNPKDWGQVSANEVRKIRIFCCWLYYW